MLTFEPVSHAYAFDGVAVPSVTQVLRDCDDFSRVDEDVMAAKSALGTAVHTACELDDEDDLDEGSVSEAVRPYLDGYRLFKRHKCARVIATELMVYHPAHQYAGKLDLITEFDGARWLIDWKTPLTINPAVALQTAAYLAALPRELQVPGIKRASLQLKADGNYRLREFAEPNDFAVFVAKLTSLRWNQRNLK